MGSVATPSGIRPRKGLLAWLPHGGALPEEEFWRRHRVIVWVLWAHVWGLMFFGAIHGFSVAHTGVVVFPAAILADEASSPRAAHPARTRRLRNAGQLAATARIAAGKTTTPVRATENPWIAPKIMRPPTWAHSTHTITRWRRQNSSSGSAPP